MKGLLSISVTLLLASAAYGQTACSNDNAFFKFDNSSGATSKEVARLGANPEFPFIRNKSNPHQVYLAIHQNAGNTGTRMSHMNELLVAAGFTNGAADVKESNITPAYIPAGTEGNMGNGNYTTEYSRLTGEGANLRAWKVTSDNGCYVYFLAKCGNAFYPKSGTRTACISTPVTLTPGSNEITLNTAGQKVKSTDDVFVYYHRRKHKKHQEMNVIPGVADDNPSAPLLLRADNSVDVVPETYRVSLSTPENTVTVCPDSTLNITANVNVEKTSEYTGNYPGKDKKEYKLVSKHVYKKSARKMRKVERKETKVARMTGVEVKNV